MENIKSIWHNYQNLEGIYQEQNRLNKSCGLFIEFIQECYSEIKINTTNNESQISL
jgi:hypothetical protein